MEPVLLRKRDRALGGLDISCRRGLEIGPLCRPLISKAASEVYYVDQCSAEDLKKKYEGDPAVDPEQLVPVDFIWNDKPLVEMIGGLFPLDYIMASHVIEHVPDLIGWLKEMRDALRNGGRLILIVPDKRFTFDVFRRTSSFKEIRAAHAERRRRPGLRCIMDHFANVVKADTWALWDDYDRVNSLAFVHGPEFLARGNQHFAEGRYVDVHAWVFTPWSFLETIGLIVDEFGLGFDLRHFQTTFDHDLEFYLQLERSDSSTTHWGTAATEARRQALWPTKRDRAMQLAG